ncbi:hypothetical protein MATL_G00243510 [Megalops atlanticus]|uniref:APC membrane recruitment protein 3 n=1 Tax=Megalops atlanticus TaxID=7932 RepID=A0A9D3T1K3_MEGAT|nr:hypothetical protein MATL_G00243510 [Megalops atlanticus]
MEELPKSPKRNSLHPPGDMPSPSMEEGHGESETCGSGCPAPSGSEASNDRGDSYTQSPASPLEPSGQHILSLALTDTPSAGWAHPGFVRKSKTHDCVAGMGRRAEAGGAGPDGGCRTPSTRRRGRLVSSVSFSGFGVSPGGRGRLLRENRSTSGRSRDIIDYRNLTPQVPFVPSIAKSIPKKRISLRRPRKAIKDLFGTKRHKQDKATSPCAPTPRAGEQEAAHCGTRKHVRRRDRPCMGLLNTPEHNDLLSDSSTDYCHNLCEDMTSLKSFGSQTGCGEIFADEENHASLEVPQRHDPDKDICEPRKASPVVGSYQGGVEQMASPAHSEVLDLFGMWDCLGRAVLLRQSPVTEGKVLNTVPVVTTPTKTDNKQPITSPNNSAQTPGYRTDVVTQKSDNQETVSTSDEGYYDYISPGLEDTSRDALTPCHSARFPRDSYSGDALYELFYDPNESGMTPIFDDEMGMSESILGLSGDLPLSMYSFHVGAEENLAPPLALDFVSQELFQSSWRGKDCLMKLCDTEISLAMGIMNWLKQRTEKTSSSEAANNMTDASRCSVHLDGGELSPKVQEGLKGQPQVDDGGAEKTGSQESMVCQGDVSPASAEACSEELVPASPESNSHVKSQIKTPTNGFCFRIFNKDSPLTPSKDLASPMLRSPGSGTSSVFLLAINKESLCESCKGSLKQGSKELYLCASCMTLIEHIKTTDLINYTGCHWSSSAGTPQSLPRGFLDSPISPCTARSDVDIVRILEQCIGQVSSMKINGSHNQGESEKGSSPSLLQLGDNGEREVRTKERKEQRHRYLKSKHKRKSSSKEKNSLGMHSTEIDRRSLPYLGMDSPNSPSFLEIGGLGLVMANGLNELALETYKSPCSDVSATSAFGNPTPAQTPRPKSLPLSSSACSELASGQSHGTAPLGRVLPRSSRARG